MKVKICGITDPQDAEYAARAGADYIGIIFAAQSKRRVTASKAKEIAEAARQGGAEPIGVYAEETWEEIIDLSERAGIKMAQLHGSSSRELLPVLKPYFHLIVYAITVDGSLFEMARLPEGILPLFDSLKRGTAFDWRAFVPPKKASWFLAGGLNPHNVASAIRLLKPYGVDVASGVELPNSCKKDPRLVKAFIQSAKKEVL